MPPSKPANGIALQDRDLAVLRGLFESRIMTAAHIASLYFDGKSEYTKKRLQKLKAAAVIGERKRRVNEPYVLFLKRDGLTLLQQHGILTEYPRIDLPVLEKRARVGEFTLRHELEVMDVKVAFHAAIKKSPKFSIAEFSTWPLLYQFEATRLGHNHAEVVVKPDGFIRIHEKEADGGLSEHTFFLEVDRSSETQDTLVTRAGCYLNYYKSGDFAVRNGGDRADYKEYPFRVLFVFKSAERRNNTAERLLQSNPPILTHVWLATIEEVTRNPLDAVWFRPVDYRKATENTPFDSNRTRLTWGYQRQMAREEVVEQRALRCRILDDNATA